MKAPSERELQRIERELKRSPRGAQKAVGGGIYMRLDRSGRRRFQFLRSRTSDGQPGGTHDSWQEAHDARALRDAAAIPAMLRRRLGRRRSGTRSTRCWPRNRGDNSIMVAVSGRG
jgi:hypothetical protein